MNVFGSPSQEVTTDSVDDGPDRFHERSQFEGTHSRRWQHGCEAEVVGGRDNDYVIFSRNQFLEQGNISPARAKQDQFWLMLLILVVLAFVVIDEVFNYG